MHSGSDSFSRVAREWRRRLEQEPGRRDSRGSRPAPVWAVPGPAEPWRFRQAMAFKRRLLRQYAHAQLHEVLPGQERETGYGVCYLLERHEEMPAGSAVPAAHADRLAADLQLVRGIGPATERALRQAGVVSLADLAGHPRFGEGARELQAALAGGDARAVASFVRRKHPPSHPALLHACALCGLEGLLFLDLETLGLFGAPIILFGLARVEAGRVRVEQYLVRDVAEEAAALAAVAAAVESATALVTYNGRAFDVPYLESRGAYYGLALDFSLLHFDLLHFVRRAWRDSLPDCRLTSLEEHLLGCGREEDVPSALVPDFYTSYLHTGNPGPLVPIVEHNRRDLLTMLAVLFRLWEERG